MTRVKCASCGASCDEYGTPMERDDALEEAAQVADRKRDWQDRRGSRTNAYAAHVAASIAAAIRRRKRNQ